MPSDLAELRGVAERLAGSPIQEMRPVGTGRNSRVYRLETRNRAYALKSYPSDPTDSRDRLGAEFRALAFLDGRGPVPRALASAPEAGAALYEWIEGEPVVEHDARDMDALLALFRTLHALRLGPGAEVFAEAAEACPSAAEIFEQIDRRIARLAATGRRELTAFLSEIAAVRNRYTEADTLPPPVQTLSPSDAGFHNALRVAPGGLVFVDFEYFGWDDPVKLVADVLWHPGMSLSAAERRQFLTGAADIYSGDANFRARLEARFPLFGIRWILIILNEFLDHVWQRRVQAGERRSRKAVEQGQLAKAEAMLRIVSSGTTPVEMYAR